MTEKQAEQVTCASLMDYAAVRLHYELTAAKAALVAQRSELSEFVNIGYAPQPDVDLPEHASSSREGGV